MTFFCTLGHIHSYSLRAVGMGMGVTRIKTLHPSTGLMDFILLLTKLSKNTWLCFSGTGEKLWNYLLSCSSWLLGRTVTLVRESDQNQKIQAEVPRSIPRLTSSCKSPNSSHGGGHLQAGKGVLALPSYQVCTGTRSGMGWELNSLKAGTCFSLNPHHIYPAWHTGGAPWHWRGVGGRACWLACREERFVSDSPRWKSECNFP